MGRGDSATLKRLSITLVGTFVAAALLLWKLSLDGGLTDFQVFYLAARHWDAPYAPESLAALPASVAGCKFVYPPTFLLLTYPFSRLPYGAGYLAWGVLSFALLVHAATFVRMRGAALLILALILGVAAGALQLPRVYQPLLENLLMGHATGFVGAALIAGGLVLDRRPALAGALFAVAACIKPQAVLLAPLLLWGRRQAILAAIVTGLGLVLLSFAFGPARWLEWLVALKVFQTGGWIASPILLVDAWWWRIALAVLAVSFVWRERNLTGLLVGAVLVFPNLHPYDLAALCVLAAAWVWDWRARPVLAVAGVLLLAGFASHPHVLLGTTLAAMAALLTGHKTSEARAAA